MAHQALMAVLREHIHHHQVLAFLQLHRTALHPEALVKLGETVVNDENQNMPSLGAGIPSATSNSPTPRGPCGAG